MNIISIGTDRKIFEEDSAVRQRIVEYGKIFGEMHVIVFTLKSLELKAESLELSKNVWVYPTNSKNKFFYIFDAFKIGKALSSKFKALNSVISTQDPFETGLVGLSLKLFCKLPLQVQIHTDFANKYFIFHSLLNFLRFPIGLFVLSFADSVRVVSERVAKSIHSLTHNVSVLPIYTEYKPQATSYKSQVEDKITFLTVARLEKEKDLKTAIQAFKKVLDKIDVEDPEQSRRTEFVVVGDGSERESLELLVKSLKLQDRIRFVGWQSDSARFYEEADIYVSTSLYEGYGMSIVEAASCGLALVISDTGVAGGLFKNGEAAIVCKQKDVAGFAGAMFKLASDRSLGSRLGERAKSVADKHQTNLTDYLNKYKQSVIDAGQFFNSGHGIFKKNILLRYLVAGITGATTQIGLLYFFTDIVGFWYLYSSIFSFLTAIIVSFLLQKFWTFADKKTDKMHHQFGKYMVVAILGLLVNTLAMFLLVDLLFLWYILAQIITGVIIAVMNFLMYKFFIFHKN